MCLAGLKLNQIILLRGFSFLGMKINLLPTDKMHRCIEKYQQLISRQCRFHKVSIKNPLNVLITFHESYSKSYILISKNMPDEYKKIHESFISY